jgi:hypothetical protein
VQCTLVCNLLHYTLDLAEPSAPRGYIFHDLHHSGNAWAAASGAGLRDLMARMGHDSERAAIIYRHQARGADAVITQAIDAHADAELRLHHEGDGDPWPVVPVG